jgi:hypothetical protein
MNKALILLFSLFAFPFALIGQVDSLTIYPSGNVGIGTASDANPSDTFTVNGSINATGSETVGGNISVNGSATIGGNTTISGSINSSGPIYYNGILTIESSSNSNGSWVKFCDGTLICYSPTFDYGSSGYWVSSSKVWTFPYSNGFISNPAVIATQQLGIGPNDWAIHFWVDSIAKTSAKINVTAQGAAGGSTYASVIAIGRWK